MDKDKKKKDDWVRVASKSRAGRFYLFNKSTGETQWLPSKDNEVTKVKKQLSPPKLSVNKASKTPAQDRLKRLQHTLKTCQSKLTTTRPSSVQKLKTCTEQENKLKDEPSTSSKAKRLDKSPKKATKRSHCASSSNQTDNAIKIAKPSDFNNDKELNHQDRQINSPSFFAFNQSGTSATELINNSNLQNIEVSKGSTFSNLRLGIVKKIKEICKIPFTTSKNDEKLLSKDDNVSGVIKTTKFKPASKTKVQQRLSTPAKQEAIINQIELENLKAPDNKSVAKTLAISASTNCNISSYSKGSANSRLERLKQSLLSQQQSCKIKNIVPHESININTSDNSCKNSAINTANSTLKDEVEAMDWQEETDIEESISENTIVVEKSKKLLLNKSNENDNQTMGDIIDTVNENLLRFSAENQKDSVSSNKKWRTDFYYFVVDTNVLLIDLTFIEDLTKMKLCDTKGSMLYVPYAVLQELDKLKMRSGFQEGVKTRAVHAIKYLNSKFQNNSQHVQAQSALDERHHLIDINSADDCIMNCCLQVQQQVRNLLLLTEDVNLRNKAICNNIMVSTKSDLVAKRYDSSNLS